MSNNPRVDPEWKEKILRRERSGDFAYTLSAIVWDTFNTNTFTNPVPRPSICWGMLWQWARAISEVSGVPYNRLLLAVRAEYGEVGGRFHFHALVGGTNTRNAVSLSHMSEKIWRRISNGAIAQSRPYIRSLAGADYICKCLDSGKNEYETGKYSLAETVTLSDSVFRLIRGIELSSARRISKQNRQDRERSESSA